MNRRNFIKSGIVVASGLGMGSIGFPAWADDETKITILHTNDMHSRIEPFPSDGSKYAGLGGMARRAALINKIRKENKNVLLFDSGDIFQGTPYFNFYGGELEFKLMSEMGYDAATLGNHDFDAGLDGLIKQLPHANFPFITSNYDFSDTEMFGNTLKFKVFKKENIKIGVYGLGIELNGLVPEKLYGNTKYIDPIEVAQSQESFLKNEMNCDIIICLSHLGKSYRGDKICDEILATQVRHTNLILGGHTHTFMDQLEAFENKGNKKTYVMQAGWGGLVLGRIDLIFKRLNENLTVSAYPVKISKKTNENMLV